LDAAKALVMLRVKSAVPIDTRAASIAVRFPQSLMTTSPIAFPSIGE
jgi:hypothetical protein